VSRLRFDLMRLDLTSHRELESALRSLKESDVPELLEMAADEDPKLQAVASWLLYRGIEAGLPFGNPDWATWMSHLDGLTQWAAKLHFCQAYHLADIPLAEAARATLTRWFETDRPFVRAWAMSALVHDATLRGGDEDQIESLVSRGLGDPAASVRARARHVSKSLQNR